MRAPRGLHLEQAVHALERDGLGLGDEEENEDGGEDHEGGEEHVDAEAHRVEHLLGEAGDDEVPEPVVGGGEGLAEGAGVLVEHLRVDDPGGAVPRGGVEGGPEVEEEDGGDAARVEAVLGVVLRVGDLDVAADEVHAEAAADGAAHEQDAAAHVVDEPEDPDEGEDRLDDAEDARGEEGRVGACDADAAEDGGAVVVDGVNSGA